MCLSVGAVTSWLLDSFEGVAGFDGASLSRYADAFVALGVDGATLSDLDGNGLKDAGVDNAVHRSKLLRAWNQHTSDIERTSTLVHNARVVSWQGFSMEEALQHNSMQARSALIRTPEHVLASLQRGNTRFWMGMAQRPEANAFQRRALIMQQYPSVCVVGCSDSRVPVEIVFDLGLGDMFVIRVAGNVVGGPVTASVEYAVNHLHVKMVLVMGHEGCGAVKAAMLPEAQIHAESDNLRDFLLDVKAGMGQERLANVSDPRARDREAVITNVVSQLRALKAISSVAEKVRSGDVILSGAFYDLSSGIVDFVNQVKPDEC